MANLNDDSPDAERIRAAAYRVVLAVGAEAATPEAVAAEAGCSAADTARYLTDRDDVLIAALKESHRAIARRYFGRTAGLIGLAALRQGMLDLLPLDREREAETSLEVAAWQRALTSPRVAECNRSERDDLHVLIRGLLRDARDNLEVVPGCDPDRTAAQLLALVDGLSLHLLLYPDRLDQDTAVRALLDEVDHLAHETPGR